MGQSEKTDPNRKTFLLCYEAELVEKIYLLVLKGI